MYLQKLLTLNMLEFVFVRALATRELVFTPDWREEDDGGREGGIIVR